ncbi:hypothetical protein HGRIS_006877 [Hohenbuehelia grisea]|uniref:BHLH domain-containing protein n=1 Tax=Hohenbuehelia grisea TaxID=104357 RepID=A0ABR3JAF9_9AGAR
MAPATPANHDPALSAPAPVQPVPAAGGAAPVGVPGLGGLDQEQIMALLRNLPNVFNKLAEQGKDSDAAQTLSNLSQASPFPLQLQHQVPQGVPPPHGYPMQGISEAGPSSHPRGPPNLGQLSTLALQQTAGAQIVPARGPVPPQGLPMQMSPTPVGAPSGEGEEGADGEGGAEGGTTTTSGGRRRSAAMGSDEWTRIRKDNHKEVERRRRGNINEGINELGRIVPNSSGDKAKGAILARAVQYIHHLKENEARNIEKWTLEKLLMDQAMGDLQGQLGDLQTQNAELNRLRAELEAKAAEAERTMAELRAELETKKKALEEKGDAPAVAGTKRRSEDAEEAATDGASDAKRQKVD